MQISIVSGGDDKYNYMFTASNNDTQGIIRKMI